jgi:D-alanine-D-alanine ligase
VRVCGLTCSPPDQPQMKTPPRSVLVLHEAFGEEARADELDALLQVSQISEALGQLPRDVETKAIGLNLEAVLETVCGVEPGCVFNLVESLNGHGELIGLVPALLESASVSFTGSGSTAINLSSNKILAKRWMRLHGIATPDWLGAADREDKLRAGSADGEWIVKSLWEHASLGLDDHSVVKGRAAAWQRIRQCRESFGGHWFAERYIDGREFNISMLEQNGQPYVLPIAEMTFVDYPPDKPRIVGYAAKWDENAPEFAATQRRFATLNESGRRTMDAVAKRCWTLFGLRGYARVDIRTDRQGKAWVLEVNANPCLSRDAGFAAAATEAGFRYRQIIEMVLQAAIRPALPVLRRTG